MTRLNEGLVVASLLLMAVASRAQAQPDDGDPVAGKASWSRVGCYACHGYAAQGSQTTGPQLSGRNWTFPAFNQLVRHPVNAMPPYTAKVLSDREVRDQMAYVNSVPVKNR
jgi:mono/diheme cytochrome c family protein